MNDATAKQIVALLLSSLQQEARKNLPDYVRDSWLSALSEIVEKSLYHLWVNIISNIDKIKIDADVVEIIDERERPADDPT